MKVKLFALSIIMMFVFSNLIVLVSVSDENHPVWPTSWVLADIDDDESGYNTDYRDVNFAYYYFDNNFLYFRLECFGYPNFTAEPKSRYKWFLDVNDPYNMAWQGGKVYEAEYLLFVEDTPKPGGDGVGDVYLLNDIDEDGLIGDDWSDYVNEPGALDSNVAGYRIIDHCIDVYIRRSEVGNPVYSYFTWATDQEDPNLDSSANERSENYWNEDLSKADLSISVFGSVDLVVPGDSLTYILQVTNHGPQDAENVSIKDLLPDLVTFIDADPVQDNVSGQTLWWNFSSLGVGFSVFIFVNVSIVDDASAGIITNMGIVYNGTYDPMPGNNNACEDTTIDLDIDVIPPSNVTGLTVLDAKNGKLDLSWDAANDDIGVDHYEIHRDGLFLLNVTSISFQDTGLINGRSYTYIVRAVDAAGNKGGFSDQASGTPTRTSNPYTPPNNNPSEDKNQAPIINDSVGEKEENKNNTYNDCYTPLSLPIITGPSEGYVNIIYNFSLVVNNSDFNIKFKIDWGDVTINESGYVSAGSFFNILHKWINSGEYTINVTAYDGRKYATTNKVIKIYQPEEPVTTGKSSNFFLLLLALLALLLLILLLLIAKRKKDDAEEVKK